MATKLKGKYVQDDTLTNAHIKSDAAIALSKLETGMVLADGSVELSSDWDIGGTNKVTNMPAPTTDSDAARKKYVDDQINVRKDANEWQDSCVTKRSTDSAYSWVANDRCLIEQVGSLNITAVNTSTETLTVAGDQTTLIAASDIILVKLSTGNDGYYTVVSSTFVTDHTDIVVAEDVTDATVDGGITYADGAFTLVGVDKIATYSGTVWTGIELTVGTRVTVDDAINSVYTLVSYALGWIKQDLIDPTNNSDMAGNRVINVADPIDPQDAATKEYVDTRLEDSSELYNEQRTVTSQEMTAKKITLSAAPAMGERVMLDIIGGTSYAYDIDYTITGMDLDWNGLGLDGTIAQDDNLRIIYPI